MTSQSRVAIVVGAAQGIGAATARRLSDDGYAVVVADRDSEKGTSVAAGLTDAGGTAQFCATDVAQRGSVDEMVRETIVRFGRIDSLVVAAGVLGGQTPFAELSEQDWAQVLDVNLTGALRCCQAVVPAMLARASGRIILLSSWARDGSPGFLSYGVSKAGIVALMRTLAKELTPSGILVNCVEPGRTMTDMVVSRFSPDQLQSLMRDQPLGRYAEPEEIAEVVAFLANERCTFTSGSIYQATGAAI